jgi:D-glycero-D-manno-heptose 1,7-bisphosphate phosphatase
MGIDQIGGRRAVFLDRDGVLNRNVFNPATGEYESPGRPEDFVLAPNALESLSRLQAAGYLLFLVSNQPNYAKGKSTLEELEQVHALLTRALDQAGIVFAEFFYCFHHPHGVVPSHSGKCDCRKPSAYFLHRAAAEFGVTLSDSWMVGDRASDIECGQAAGVRTIRVLEDQARDIGDAATLILTTEPLS